VSGYFASNIRRCFFAFIHSRPQWQVFNDNFRPTIRPVFIRLLISGKPLNSMVFFSLTPAEDLLYSRKIYLDFFGRKDWQEDDGFVIKVYR